MDRPQDVKAENEQVKEETKAYNDGSICGYESLYSLLSANLKPEIFQVIFLLSLSLCFFSAFFQEEIPRFPCYQCLLCVERLRKFWFH